MSNAPTSKAGSTGSARSEERRRIVMISGLVAAVSFTALSIGPRHAFVIWIYGAFLLAAISYVVLQMVKTKRAEKLRKQARKEGRA